MNRSSFVSKLFTPVITLLVLAYFGYQIYGYVSDPFSTTLAYTYQVEDTVDISGYVVRQEQVLTGDADFEFAVPVARPASAVSADAFTAVWEPVDGATGYLLSIEARRSLTPEEYATDFGSSTTKAAIPEGWES